MFKLKPKAEAVNIGQTSIIGSEMEIKGELTSFHRQEWF
jgi:hypothetical protein